MRFIAFTLILVICACSTSPSRYEESSGKEGYSDKIVDNELRFASFQGNSNTKKDRAELYAKFRAIEVCHDLKKTYAHILFIKDKTFEKQISQTTSNYPTDYYGASPYYGRDRGYGGYGVVTTNTWNETYTYPLFEVYFECTNKPLDARISFKILSQSQMKDLVRDVKGGVQIKDILPDSPNRDQFKVADIITKANDTRVENILELYKASRIFEERKLKVDFIRDGVNKSAEVKFLDVTKLVDQSQNEIVKKACKIDEIKATRPICK